MASRYPIPAELHVAEIVEKRSRFICALTRIQSPEEAKAFVDERRALYPDARHTCWAYVAGTPGSSHPCGMSDDGEPHNTAGRPMLQVLQNCGIGEIIAVVTRYFGGTKLGTGGLVRAYSGAVQHALETLPTKERIDKTSIKLQVNFSHEQALRHQLGILSLPVLDAKYSNSVTLTTELPTDEYDEIMKQITSALPHGAVKSE